MISLNNACAPVAAAMSQVLKSFEVEHRVLRFRRKGEEGHVIVIFVHEKRLRAYDSNGSLTLPKNLTMKSSPKALAQAFSKEEKSKKKVTEASWY